LGRRRPRARQRRLPGRGRRGRPHDADQPLGGDRLHTARGGTRDRREDRRRCPAARRPTSCSTRRPTTRPSAWCIAPHADVEVPEYDDLNQVETIEADPVDYFQVAGSPKGAVFSFNGAAYALSATQVASFKAALDTAIAGLTL
jgi:hypothetical protein